MSRSVRLLAVAAVALAAGGGSAATNVAQVRMHCWSVQVNPAQATQPPANEYGLGFYSGFDPGSLNGEFYLTGDPTQTHESGFVLQITMNAFPLDPLEGGMVITVPEDIDGDGDEVPDFYEVDRPIPSTTTTGRFVSTTDEGPVEGTVTTRWSRPAGSRTGQCELTFSGTGLFEQLPTFTHTFEIAQYNGTLTYVASSNRVEGVVSVRRLDHPDGAFTGPIVFTNEAGVLSFNDQAWTNGQAQAVTLSVGEIERDARWPTIYFGALAFSDGDPNTFEMDYELFYIEVEDPNDADGDGIPDLGDPPSAVPPPQLGVRLGAGEVMLDLVGAVGRSYEVQSTPTLAPSAWVPATTVTLSSPTQAIEVPSPAGATAFWRVKSL